MNEKKYKHTKLVTNRCFNQFINLNQIEQLHFNMSRCLNIDLERYQPSRKTILQLSSASHIWRSIVNLSMWQRVSRFSFNFSVMTSLQNVIYRPHSPATTHLASNLHCVYLRIRSRRSRLQPYTQHIVYGSRQSRLR